MANANRSPIDPALVNLSAGLFEASRGPEIPLEVFRLHVEGEPTPITPRRYDSIAPMAMTSAVPAVMPEAEGIRRASWAVSLALVAGLVGIGVGALSGRNAAPAAAAPVAMTAPAPVKAAPVAPAASPVAVPVAAAEPLKAAEPVKAGRARAVAPRAVQAAAPDADLPAFTPPAAAPPAPSGELSQSAAMKQITGAAERAGGCREEGAGTLHVPVSVTFASSGRVTTARVNGGPLVGTPAGSCLAMALRGVTVPPFEGSPVTVNASVHLR
jgi:hypothetical protein